MLNGRNNGFSQDLKETDNKEEVIKKLAIMCLKSNILGYENTLKTIETKSNWRSIVNNEHIQMFDIDIWDD